MLKSSLAWLSDIHLSKLPYGYLLLVKENNHLVHIRHVYQISYQYVYYMKENKLG